MLAFKLQTVTAQSTHEAELIAVALASNELIWIRKFIVEIGFAIPACTSIARRETAGLDHDLPGIDAMTGFAPDLSKDKADGARDGEQYTLEPPYLFNDNKVRHHTDSQQPSDQQQH